MSSQRHPDHSLNLEASFSDQLGGAARSEEADVMLDERFSEVQQACLVVDGQYG